MHRRCKGQPGNHIACPIVVVVVVAVFLHRVRVFRVAVFVPLHSRAQDRNSSAASFRILAKSKERVFGMEDVGNKQESNASGASVYELPGEPAIVINGVPEVIPSNSTIPPRDTSSNVETQRQLGLGEWLEGREVQKLFMGRYYSGIVTEFDKDSGWYRVHYEDGDSEDLDWQELEEVLLPLDVTVPLKALAQRIVGKSKKPGHKSGKSVARSQNPQIKRRATKGK